MDIDKHLRTTLYATSRKCPFFLENDCRRTSSIRGGASLKEWRDPLGSPGARRYVKIDRDKFGNRIFHVGLELYFDQIEAWKCVLSFDNYEQKGCHGHRHHADGSRTKIKMPELTVHEAIDWACDEIERKIGLERFRYQDELSNVYRNRLNYREGR